MRPRKFILLIGALILAIAVGAYISSLHEEIAVLTTNQNFDISYEHSRSIVVHKWKGTQLNAAVYYDLDDDLADDSTLYFDRRGKLVGSYADHDFDGTWETEYMFDKNGRITSIFRDTDDYIVYDLMEIIDQNDTIIYVDKNGDHRFADDEKN